MVRVLEAGEKALKDDNAQWALQLADLVLDAGQAEPEVQKQWTTVNFRIGRRLLVPSYYFEQIHEHLIRLGKTLFPNLVF